MNFFLNQIVKYESKLQLNAKMNELTSTTAAYEGRIMSKIQIADQQRPTNEVNDSVSALISWFQNTQAFFR